MIDSATVSIAVFSKHRTNGKPMKRAEAIRAFIAGADLEAFCINGCPCSTYCSIRDMKVGSRIELVECRVSLAYLLLEAKHFAAVAERKPVTPASDIPAFMNDLPVELD